MPQLMGDGEAWGGDCVQGPQGSDTAGSSQTTAGLHPSGPCLHKQSAQGPTRTSSLPPPPQGHLHSWTSCVGASPLLRDKEGRKKRDLVVAHDPTRPGDSMGHHTPHNPGQGAQGSKKRLHFRVADGSPVSLCSRVRKARGAVRCTLRAFCDPNPLKLIRRFLPRCPATKLQCLCGRSTGGRCPEFRSAAGKAGDKKPGGLMEQGTPAAARREPSDA